MPGDLTPDASERILIVDDDLVSRRMLSLQLQKTGYAVTEAASASQARRVLERNGAEAFACVVTDYLMPHETGLDLIEWLHGFDNCLASVVVTGGNERSVVPRSLRFGASGFLEKPVAPLDLTAAVQKASASTASRRVSALTETSARRGPVAESDSNLSTAPGFPGHRDGVPRAQARSRRGFGGAL